MSCLPLLPDHPPVCIQEPDRAVCSSCAVVLQWDAFTSTSLSDHRAVPACAFWWWGPCDLQKDEGHRTILAG